MLEKLARDKRSSLVQKFVNYRRKQLYNIGPWKEWDEEKNSKEGVGNEDVELCRHHLNICFVPFPLSF